MRFLPLLLLLACASGEENNSCVSNRNCESAVCVNGTCEPSEPAEDAGPGDDASTPDVSAPDPDAGGEDAGPRDAGGMDMAEPMDAGPDANVRCAPALFCDDFETPPPASRYDSTVAGDSVIELSTTQAHSGSQSLRILAAQGSPGVSVGFRPFDDSQAGERWVRAWYFLPPTMGLTVLALESPTAALTFFTAGPGYTAINTYMFPGEQQFFESSLPLPNGVWTCVEAHLDYDGPATAELYIDGARAAQANLPLPRALSYVRMGASFRDADDPVDYDVYIDDIAVSFERLGCD